MKLVFTFFILFFANVVLAQNIGIGTTTPDSSSALEIKSTSQGFLPPRMTTIQRNAINNPATGLQIYNTTTDCLEIYAKGRWQNMYCATAIENADTIPSTLSNGLVAYYPFNGNANDESGNGNNGTVYGATLTTDRFGNIGKAYNFSNNYILIPSSNLFNSNDLSVCMWVSSSSIQRQIALIRLNYSNASNEHFGIAFNDINQYGVEIAAKYNNPNCTPGLGWQKNEKIQNIMNSNFHHIVGSIIGNTMNLYIDGSLAQTITTPYSQTSSCWNGDIQIGRNWSSFTDYFNGKIDDIRIYNRALTQEEITYLATH